MHGLGKLYFKAEPDDFAGNWADWSQDVDKSSGFPKADTYIGQYVDGKQ